ncbi:hypothetical protein KQI52_11105 [bacterium]|nr:hypothetical protein [bacterium]
MKKNVVLVAVALFLFFTAIVPARAFEWVTLAPDGDENPVTFSIAGHDRVYHQLKPGKTMYYDIAEHDHIRVITRADLRDVDESEVVYTFRLGYDEGNMHLFARAATADDNVELNGKPGIAGDERIVEKKTPKAAKRIYIKLDKDAPMPVFFRVQRDRFETIKQENFVVYTPSRYNNPVNVSVRENLLTYYGVDPKGNLEVAVNGPTVIKVLTRVMMEDHMRREIKFPLAIYEDSVLKRTVLINTSASEVAILPDHPDRRPTRGDDLYINVPAGTHTYTFDLPENEYEAILRFFIPESDLAMEAE